MKHLHNILEDKDYILSEEQKFLERGCNISVEKRNEMEEYYDAYKHELGMMEDGEWEFLELSQEMIDKKKNMIQEIQDTNLDFALRRMTDVMAYLYGCIRNYLRRNNKFDQKQFNRIWSQW